MCRLREAFFWRAANRGPRNEDDRRAPDCAGEAQSRAAPRLGVPGRPADGDCRPRHGQDPASEPEGSQHPHQARRRPQEHPLPHVYRGRRRGHALPPDRAHRQRGIRHPGEYLPRVCQQRSRGSSGKLSPTYLRPACHEPPTGRDHGRAAQDAAVRVSARKRRQGRRRALLA